MDEIDSIGSTRIEGSSGGDSEVQRTMLELLNQLDGFEATKNIKVKSQRFIERVANDVCPRWSCKINRYYRNCKFLKFLLLQISIMHFQTNN